MDINIGDNQNKELQDDYVVIAIDSTGIKITNRGQWMGNKWKIKKKGYLKIHISIYVKSRKILSMMKVTDEHVHDSKVLPVLIHNIIKLNKTVGKLFADGAYDSNNIFRCLVVNGILPCIKVRKNAKVRLKKDTSLETYQLNHKEMICKNGMMV